MRRGIQSPRTLKGGIDGSGQEYLGLVQADKSLGPASSLDHARRWTARIFASRRVAVSTIRVFLGFKIVCALGRNIDAATQECFRQP